MRTIHAGRIVNSIRIARITRMGRTPLMPLVTTGILCGPFASFAQFAAQIWLRLRSAVRVCGKPSGRWIDIPAVHFCIARVGIGIRAESMGCPNDHPASRVAEHFPAIASVNRFRVHMHGPAGRWEGAYLLA